VAPAYSMLADYFPKSSAGPRPGGLRLRHPAGHGGRALVGGLLAVHFGWRTAFIVVGALGVALAPIFRLVVRDPRRGGADMAAGDTTTVQAPAAPLREVVRVLAAKPSFWLLSFGAASSSVCGYGVALWLPSFFMRSLGLTLRETAWYYSGIAFFGGLIGHLAGRGGGRPAGRQVQGRLSADPGRRLPDLGALLPAGHEQRLAGRWTGRRRAALTLAFAIFLIPTGLNLAWLGPITAAVQHLAPAPMRTTASALFLLINNLLGIAVGTYYFGLVSDLLKPAFGQESLRWSIYTGMGFYLVAALLFFLASRRLARTGWTRVARWGAPHGAIDRTPRNATVPTRSGYKSRLTNAGLRPWAATTGISSTTPPDGGTGGCG
jgi:hypothetical protein